MEEAASSPEDHTILDSSDFKNTVEGSPEEGNHKCCESELIGTDDKGVVMSTSEEVKQEDPVQIIQQPSFSCEHEKAVDPNGPIAKPEEDTTSEQCPICFCEFSVKTTLPSCQHSFCFLCIKGVALRHGTCPICRTCIPRRLFRNPCLQRSTGTVEPNHSRKLRLRCYISSPDQAKKRKECDAPHWFYRASTSGWWQYEKRHESEIEEAYQRNDCSIDLVISGYLYCIDFITMSQYRKNTNECTNTNANVRAIKRLDVGADVSSLGGALRGIAGLSFPHMYKPL
ncbi:hypothetical protein AB6A40_000776 [Gnathostoma spinigerum]|uniref:E3 ubiquitin-protein ligase n=1 Tax=Gnathostoma spinigerum TaxID=75299 RepID=A0ABD6E4U6_9BILA